AWLHAADVPEIETRGTHHFLSDARLGMDAAVHGQGIALGDTMTASELLNKGLLVLPFDRSVPAIDSFYVACRNDVRTVPIVKVFIDWLFAACDASNRARAGTTFSAYRPFRLPRQRGRQAGEVAATQPLPPNNGVLPATE